MDSPLRIGQEIAEALTHGRPVVALETSVVAQGLPPPDNVDAMRRQQAAVRAAGAVPAAIAVIGGAIVVGASDDELSRLADPRRAPAKAACRDLAPLVVARRDAGTTVSATAWIAARAGVRVFATGGIGGVHRLPPGEPPTAALDVSADLGEIARNPVCVVCAGPKAILDLAATSEALETLGILTLGFTTGEMPAFYSEGSGIPLEHRVEDAREAAAVLRVHWDALERREGALVFVPPPEPVAPALVEAAIADALDAARAQGVRGKAVTPFLLDAVSRATQGRARSANVALLERNARVAGEIAAALARRD